MDKAAGREAGQGFAAETATAAKDRIIIEDAIASLQENPGLVGNRILDSPVLTGTGPGKLLHKQMRRETVDLKNRIEQATMQTAMANLDSQFSAAEMTQMLERTFDPSADAEENIYRLNLFLGQLDAIQGEKQRIREWMATNETLEGFKFTPIARTMAEMRDRLPTRTEKPKKRAKVTIGEPRVRTEDMPGAPVTFDVLEDLAKEDPEVARILRRMRTPAGQNSFIPNTGY